MRPNPQSRQSEARGRLEAVLLGKKQVRCRDRKSRLRRMVTPNGQPGQGSKEHLRAISDNRPGTTTIHLPEGHKSEELLVSPGGYSHPAAREAGSSLQGFHLFLLDQEPPQPADLSRRNYLPA